MSYPNMLGFNQMNDWKTPSWLKRFQEYGMGNSNPDYWKNFYNKNPFQAKNDPRSFYPTYYPDSMKNYYNQDIQNIGWGKAAPQGGFANLGAQTQKGMANKLAYDARFIFPNYNQGTDLSSNQAMQLMPNIITGADAQSVIAGSAARKPVAPARPTGSSTGGTTGAGGSYNNWYQGQTGGKPTRGGGIKQDGSGSDIDAWNQYVKDYAKYESDLAAYNASVAGLGSAEAKRLENEAMGYFSMPGVAVDWSQGLGGVTKNNYLQQYGPDFVNQGPLTYPYQGSAGGSSSSSSSGTTTGGSTGSSCSTGTCGYNSAPHATNPQHQKGKGTPAQSGKDATSFATGTVGVDGRQVSDKDIDDFEGINDQGNDVGNGFYFGTRNEFGEPRIVNAGDGEIKTKTATVNPTEKTFQNPFGEEYPDDSMPITGDWQRTLSSLAPALEGLMNFNMTGMNQGIIPLPAQMRLNQTYFDPRRQTVDDLTNNLLGVANRQAGLAKTQGAQGLANALGARGQSGQMAKAIGDQVTAPAYQQQGENISNILQNQWNAKDDLTAQQQEIDIMNMKSKAGFSDALRQDIVVGANMIGQRIWDTSMSNKYGWTPQQTGWVNAQLAELAHQYNMSEIELKYRLEKALQDSQGSGWDDFMSGLTTAATFAATL